MSDKEDKKQFESMREHALHAAIEDGDLKQVAKLLESGVDPNCIIEGMAPLHLLTFHTEKSEQDKQCLLAKKLIEYKANINIGMIVQYSGGVISGRTPLHLAVEYRYIQLIRLYLEHGANPNIKDEEDGETPLHYFANYDRYYSSDEMSIAYLLLNAGANPEIENNDNYTPLDLVIAAHYSRRAVELMLQYVKKRKKMPQETKSNKASE